MWGRFTKSGLQLESVLQEPLRTNVCKTWVSAVAFLVSSHSWTTDSVRSVSTGLLLSGPKLCSLMKEIFAFPWKSGSQSLEEERRGTESTLLEVQCKVSTVSDGLGCHVICWCWSTVFSEVQGQHSRIPGSFRALHAADQLYGDADSFSNRTWHLHTVPKLPVPGLRTMVSLFLIGQQTRLTLTP